MKNLLLDTCALLWLASGDPALSQKAKARIEESELVFVSAISAWEIALKAKKGELVLPIPANEWFPRAVAQHGVVVLPLVPEDLIASAVLPDHHRDPADRFIVAQALSRDLCVVTADAQFAKYGVETLV